MNTRSLAFLLLIAGCDKKVDPVPESNTPKGVLKIAPIALGFGAVEVHSPGAEASFQLGNGGTADVKILDVALTGEGMGFAMTPFEPFTLKPSEQASVDINFAPPAVGAVSGAVTVVSDDPDHLVTRISLDGSGTEFGEDPDPTDPAGVKIDVFLLMDTAYSYSCYHPDLEHFAGAFVEELFTTFTDVTVGVGVYDDYVGVGGAVEGSTAAGGHPYRVMHLLSNDKESVKRSADGLQMTYGGDSWGTGFEALYQVALGKGLDMDCDHVYEPVSDILPFKSDENDAFGGHGGQAFSDTVLGIGDRAGVGWRLGARHVVILAADNAMRDEDHGGLPTGTCGAAAGSDLAVRACAATDVHVLGINVYEYQSDDNLLQNQFIDLATRTNSYIDVNGDGVRDDPAVLYGSWDWPPMRSVMNAVKDLTHE